jgi:hypothetical protein
MRNLLLLFIHFITLVVRLLRPGGLKSVAAENPLLKQQLLIIRRPKTKAPNLRTSDRFILGWLARFAVIVKPATLLAFHKALVTACCFLYLTRASPGPKARIVI